MRGRLTFRFTKMARRERNLRPTGDVWEVDARAIDQFDFMSCFGYKNHLALLGFAQSVYNDPFREKWLRLNRQCEESNATETGSEFGGSDDDDESSGVSGDDDDHTRTPLKKRHSSDNEDEVRLAC